VSVEAEVRRLADLEAIRDLARRYAHCVWQKDAAGAASLFAENGVMDTGDRPPLVGRQAIRDTYTAMFQAADLHPTIHNHVVDFEAGGPPDSATGTCYLHLEAHMDGVDRVGSGVYRDEYVRTDGGWKFERRTLAMAYLAETERWAGS